MSPTLEAWDLVVPSLTTRSRLYSLAPNGIGTAFVESLSGYVCQPRSKTPAFPTAM